MRFKIINENSDYYKQRYDSYVRRILQEMNYFLEPYEFKVELVSEDDYEIDDGKAGMFLATEQTDAKIFPVVLNSKLLKTSDPEEIELTLAHEVGHGIFTYLSDIYDASDLDEEEVVEDFAQNYFRGSVDASELIGILNNLDGQVNIDKDIDESFLTEGKNLETTITQYKDKIKKALVNDRAFIFDVERYKLLDGIDDPEDAAAKEWVKKILMIDPTYQEGSNTTGLYGTFILNQYIKDPKMDTILATDLLKKFDDNKRFLDNKDINSYKDWDEIIDALANKSVSARQAERIARHANSKIKKVWENENWVVYSPLNYEGALTLGRGSSWCTADSRTARYYVQYALGDIHADLDYEDVAELQDDFFEDEDHQLDLEDNGYPTTKEEILKEYSNRAVMEFYDDGFFIYNPYDLDGSDYIYDIINKNNNSIKYQLALIDGFYDYGFDNNSEGGYVIANIHDNILPNIERVVEIHPDLRAFFEDELEIKVNYL